MYIHISDILQDNFEPTALTQGSQLDPHWMPRTDLSPDLLDTYLSQPGPFLSGTMLAITFWSQTVQCRSQKTKAKQINRPQTSGVVARAS